jgi:hypothetical protein
VRRVRLTGPLAPGRPQRHDGRLWRFVVALVVLLGLAVAPAPVLARSSLDLSADAIARDGAETTGLRQASGRAPLYFTETGFAVEQAEFIEYFSHRGGVQTFGFPISRTVRFQGLPTQFFQRIIIQLSPDGAVRPLNLLDPGLLPYTRVNGSTFPAPNERLAYLAPSPGQPGYALEVLEFVRRNAPDSFNGEPVRFFSTFKSTVTSEVAFGPSGGDANLLPLINLEIWGVPTSLPTQDPNNGGFIYQRFQRGIMHYDAACKCTQGLLLADYFKALLTGENLPGDLAAQAASSPYLRQYAPDRPTGLRQPTTLPGTDLTTAFARQAAPSSTSSLPSVTASSVSSNVSTSGSLRSRIRLGEGLATSVDVLEATGQREPLLAVLDAGAEISFGRLPANEHARYSRIGSGGSTGIRMILVSTRWQQSDPRSIATLIVHEATHLEDDLAGVDPSELEACFQFEVRAFTQQAVSWEKFYGPNGKAKPADELDTELNTWLSVHRRGPGEIDKRVRHLYARACSEAGPRPH